MLWLIMPRMMNRCFPSPPRSQQVGKGTRCGIKCVNSVSAASACISIICGIQLPRGKGEPRICIFSKHRRRFKQRRSAGPYLPKLCAEVSQTEELSRSWELDLWREMVGIMKEGEAGFCLPSDLCIVLESRREGILRQKKKKN